jgi:hypothetical protein
MAVQVIRFQVDAANGELVTVEVTDNASPSPVAVTGMTVHGGTTIHKDFDMGKQVETDRRLAPIIQNFEFNHVNPGSSRTFSISATGTAGPLPVLDENFAAVTSYTVPAGALILEVALV